MLIQMNCIEVTSRDLGAPSLPLTLTDSPASYEAAGHRSRYFSRLQLEHKAATLVLDPTHCSLHKHLARLIMNKKK